MATASGAALPSRPSPAPSGGKPRPGSRPTAKNTSDLVLRNALRYTISAREYAALHNYVLSKSRLLKKHVPTVSTVERIMDGSEKPASDKARADGKTNRGIERNGDGADTFNARAVRHSLRVFVATGTLMKLWDLVQAKLTARRNGVSVASKKGAKTSVYKSPTLRLSLSLSTILLLYRLLFRFLTRLRTHLLDSTAAPWRNRNPRIADALTSPYAPAAGASLAGLMLGIFPAKQMRLSMAIYMAFRALEFGWNALEDDGSIWGWKKVKGMRVMRERPWWFGSWMLQPFAFGQLLHALVFDRECFPKPFSDFIFKFSDTYLHARPLSLPANLPWPRPYELVDNLAEMARLSWPPYISPSLFPGKETLPASLTAISALTANTHPAVTSLACAALHPQDPSCLRTHLMMWINTFMPVARYLLLFYSAMALPRYKALYHAPVSTLRNLIARTLNMSTFVTGSISTAWASICFFQQWFPRHFLARQRFFLGGFLAGMWAWIERRHGRPAFLYSARLSVDSLWKVGVKRRWWRAMQGGDVWVFALALLVSGVVYEKDAKAIKEGTWRRGISWMRGEGWRDYGIEEEETTEAEEGIEQL